MISILSKEEKMVNEFYQIYTKKEEEKHFSKGTNTSLRIIPWISNVCFDTHN